MKVSLNWLNEFLPISNIPAESLAHTLTMAGLEVEGIEYQAKRYEHFVIAEVKIKEKHPKADKLSLCTVFDGSNTLPIVCGAPNIAAGQKVVLAKIGAVVPELEMEIKPVKLRGIESLGMICSERELDLSADHSGILVLPEAAEPGIPFADYIGANDIIFEIGITPNRPDALSHLGIARDLSALLSVPLTLPRLKLTYNEPVSDNGTAKVVIENYIACPRYSAVIVRGIEVKGSPSWLKKRIEAVGLRSINNIVDVTNYILYELGQPLHAFDLDQLEEQTIVVKDAGENLIFTTLDSKERKLEPDFLTICDGKKPVALAGVMGGENSEVRSSTKNILIESAYFNPSIVRRASKLLGLSSDSSYRFERGTNPEQTLFAAQRAAELMAAVGGGEIVTTPIDVKSDNVVIPKKVPLRYARIDSLLGYHVPHNTVRTIITSLGFIITSETDHSLTLLVPLWRPDVEREIDVIEEIARIFGYDNIPTIDNIKIPVGAQIDETSLISELRQFFVSAGMNEVVCNSLVSQHEPGLESLAISLLNPQSVEMSSLRTSLLPGMLNTVRRNINVGEKNLRLFEIGRVFRKNNEKIVHSDDFSEYEALAGLITGDGQEKVWYSPERASDFYDLKGLIDEFFKKYRLAEFRIETNSSPENNVFELLIYGISAADIISRAGRLKAELLKIFDIDQEVYYFEINIDKFKMNLKQRNKFIPLLRFPKVHRDMAFTFEKTVHAAEVIEFIRKVGGTFLQSVDIFDVFENEMFGRQKKSMAFKLEYFDRNRTLTNEEVEADIDNIISEVQKYYNAKLRG